MTGAELKARRLANGWSQRELARRAGVHHRAVQYWEAKAALDCHAHAVLRMAEALGWRIMRTTARARGGVLSNDEAELLVDVLLRMPKPLARRLMNYRVTCGAKTRKGTPCRAKSEPNRRRCRFHGGLSTGPRTAEGRERIVEAQRRRWAERGAGWDKSAP